MQVSLSEMRARVRQRADQVGTQTVTDPELDNLINVAKRKLDDLLARSLGEDYNATSVTFVTTAGTENYSLSALTSGTYYKLLALSQMSSNGFADCKPYGWRERNSIRATNSNLTVGQTYRYKITGTDLSLLPIPTAATRMEIVWVKSATALSLTTDTFDDVNGWSEYAVLDAAIAIRDKLEEDASILINALAKEEARIIASAPNRDAGEPQTVQDVQGQDAWRRFQWLGYPR